MQEFCMGFYEELIATLNLSLEKDFAGKTSHMGKACEVHPTTLKRLLDGERSKWAQMLGRIADAANVKVKKDGGVTPARDVCFVEPKKLSVADMACTPVPEDYIAVPLAAGEVAAGRGLVTEDYIKSWVLVWKHHNSVRFRSNLIAVEIGKGQDSMVPTLHPQDVLLVDRDDFKDHFAPPGNIFLIREPDNSVAVKRVALKQRNGDMFVTFYSDNVEHSPMLYSLKEDYENDISRAVIGRVVWAWSDMSRK